MSPPGNHDSRVDARIDEIYKDVAKIYEDFYFGRGKDNPPMTARMEKVENAVANTTYYARWLLGLLGAVLVAIIADIATHHR